MAVLKGCVVEGVGDMRRRMKKSPEVFRKATGQTLIPGTVNVKLDREIKIKEEFKILGAEIGEPENFLFERCRINGIDAFRIRPFNPKDESGGHGDHILEMSSSHNIPNVTKGSIVTIELFRDDV
jgi:CTP-dependent riboflavin kinase